MPPPSVRRPLADPSPASRSTSSAPPRPARAPRGRPVPRRPVPRCAVPGIVGAVVLGAVVLGVVVLGVVALGVAEGAPDRAPPPRRAQEDAVVVPSCGAPRTAAPRTDAPRTDAPRTDAPRTDAPPRVAPAATAPASPPDSTFAGGVDAIFVERGDVWWLADDGVRRSTPPRWTLAPDAKRALAEDDARRVLAAIESGEGGGYDDRSGFGPPPPPWPDVAAGVGLVAGARDVAIVLHSDGAAVEHVALATRLAESDDVTGGARARENGGMFARRLHATPPGARVRAVDPLEAIRRCALDGDAAQTLRLVTLAGYRDAASASAPLAAITAQALGRLGRFGEAADCLRRVRDASDDPRLAAVVQRLEARTRARDADPEGARAVREDAADVGARPSFGPRTPDASLDGALARLPGLVRAGRAHEAVGDVARALGDAGPADRTPLRRRAVLAAAAIALEVGASQARDLDAATRLVRHGSAPPVPAELADVAERLAVRLAGRRGDRATSAKTRAADAARGIGKRSRGG